MALFTIIAKNTPTTLVSSGLLPEFSIDELIIQSDMIVIGEVTANLPSRWNGPNGRNDPKTVAPEEIARIGGFFTDSLISINRTLKGDIVKPVVRVRSFIGETDRIRLISDNEPSLVTKKGFLFFLAKDFSKTAKVDPGAYIPVGAIQGVYEIVGGKAMSKTDEWNLDELITYIQNKLSEPTATPTAISTEPVATETPLSTETPLAEEAATPTP